MKEFKLLSAESVSVGHPDKLTDYIVDSILDEIIKEDPNARVAIDGVFKDKYLTLGGEITTTAKPNYEEIIRRSIKEVGYEKLSEEVEITLHIFEQSPDIALGTNDDVGGAGDQGTITGFACDDCEALIPLEKYMADEILRHIYFVSRNEVDFIGPDMKSQVTLRTNGVDDTKIKTVVLAIMHKQGIDKQKLIDIAQEAVTKVSQDLNIPFCEDFNLIVNGTGEFVIGGPEADSGEVGRKIVVDAYGVRVPVGGGTFNGKDPSKVDRSAAYMARYVAKNIVASGIAGVCEITVSYCIGLADPISIDYNFYGSTTFDPEIIIEEVNKLVSFRPKDIIEKLDLRKPVYSTSGLFGHFGLPGKLGLDGSYTPVPWEQLTLKDELFKNVMARISQGDATLSDLTVEEA